MDHKVFKRWDKAILDKHKKVTSPPKGYHRIKVHLVFAVKFDGRHKARLVADGHLTPKPIENIYCGVVSLRNLRLVIFLGKLNHLELWGADIGNAYLEAVTDEKLYIVGVPEFQELEGHILIFVKTLYGLKSSGKRWAEVIHGILRDMKFLPSKADPCIWLRKAPNLRCYEYIAVYVDDLCIAAESPSAIIQILKSKHHLKGKGDGKLTYHLGADYFEDPDGIFVSQPKKYIDKLADSYKRLFNEDPPKSYKTPLDKNDHPELDTSEILEGDMAAKYLTIVGQLQWLVTLGRFYIYAQVATMSRFRAAPRQGHMDRLKRIYSYAIRTKDYAIRFGTEQPDYSFLPDQGFDWTYSVYGNVHKILPDDMPDPLGEAWCYGSHDITKITLKMLCDVSKTAVKKGGSYRSEIFHISRRFHPPCPPYLIHLLPPPPPPPPPPPIPHSSASNMGDATIHVVECVNTCSTVGIGDKSVTRCSCETV